MRHKSSYDQLVDSICNHVQLQKESVRLSLLLGYTFQGISQTTKIFNDDGIATMNYLAEVSETNFLAEIYVQWEAVNPVQHMSFTNLLHDITQRNVVDTQDFDEDDEGYGQTTQEHHLMPAVDNIVGPSSQFLVGDNNNDGFDDSESCSTEESSESEEAPPSDDGTSDDEAAVNQHTELTLAQPRPIIPATHDDPDEDEELRDYMCPDYEDNPMDVWNPKVKQIRLGMYFKSK